MATEDDTQSPHDELALLGEAYRGLELLMPPDGPEVVLLGVLNRQFRKELDRLNALGFLS